MSGRHALDADDASPADEPTAADLFAAEPYPPVEVDPDIPSPETENVAPAQYVEPVEEREPTGAGPAQWVQTA